MTAPPSADRLAAVWDMRPGILGWLGAVNHKQIGRRYIVTAIAFFAIGGALAVVMRIQLGAPDAGVVSPELYNQLFTMHGTTMMFLFAVPITEAVAIYLAPLMLGARDMPLPRLNAFGYWAYLLGGLFVYSSFFLGEVPDGGWFAYPPLTGSEMRPGLNLDFWLLGVTFIEIAGIVAAIELVVLVFRTRAPGIALSQIPLFVWSSLVTAIMVLFAFPPLVIASLMLELDRKDLTFFFDPGGGGDPVLWQHLFWWFGHPEVYIILLPAMGAISMIIPTFARHRIVGYALIVAATVAIGIISFGLWAHHMYATGIPLAALSFFAAGSLVIAIPSGVQVFAWIATLWAGRVRWTVPMYWVVSALVTFVAGGITGVMIAVVPFDWQAHDTYFIVAHFHYVILGGVVFPLFAGFHYWLPKVVGRTASERWGKIGFWLTTIGFHGTFFVQHIVGLLGMPRRVYTFPAGLGWEVHNLISTVGAVLMAAGFVIVIATLVAGAIRGREVGPNPWDAGSLEWATSSPPPPYNFRRLPTTTSPDPLWDEGPVDPVRAADEPFVETLADEDASRRRIGVTTLLDANPEHITTLPAHSLWPLATAATVALLLFAVLVDAVVVGVVATGAIIACLFGWGWSRQDETGLPASDAALEREAAEERGASPLPYGSARRPLSWSGTAFGVLSIGMALAALLFSFAYLAIRDGGWPPNGVEAPALGLPALATIVLAASAAAAVALQRAARGGGAVGLQSSALALLAGGAAFLGVQWAAYADHGLAGVPHVYASTFLVTVGLHHIAALGGMGAAAVLILRLWGVADRRSAGLAVSLALYWLFIVVSWLLIAAVLYGSPYLWGRA